MLRSMPKPTDPQSSLPSSPPQSSTASRLQRPSWVPTAATLFGLALLVPGLACRSVAATDRTSSAQKGPISVDWIFSPEGRSFDDVPFHTWRRDGRAILFDKAGKDTFELLVPESGARSTFVDRDRALASLRELVGDRAEQLWGPPQSLDANGSQGLYVVDGDILLLDLAGSTFRRLTGTAQTETSASFSPDGRRIAFVRDNDLYVVSTSGGEAVRLTHDGTETLLNGTLSWVYWEELFGRRDIGYWWSDDSASIAYLQTDESEVGTVDFVHFRGPYPERITQRYPKAGTTNPAVRVGVVDVGAGGQLATTWIELSEQVGRSKDLEYLARVKWLPDSTRLALQTLSRDQRTLELWIAEKANGRAQKVLTETDPAWVNVHDDLYFLEDGQHLLWASERSGYSHLYLYRLDGTLVRQVTDGNWAIASSGGGVFWLRQAVCAIDESKGWIYYTGLEESSIERHLYRIRLDGSGRERVTLRAGTHAISFGPEAKHYFDTHSTIGSPPSLTLRRASGPGRVVDPSAGRSESRDAGSGDYRIHTVAPESLAKLELQVPEFVQVPARDGMQLPGWILKPRDFDPSREYPLILYVYGGPSAPTVANGWDDDIYFDQMLADAGYLVARCDNRGSTAISKTLESSTHLRSIGDVERNDYVDAARWFKNLAYVDPDRVGIWGWSGGGSMTLLMLTRSKEFKAGISVAPVTDWTFYDTKWAETMMKTPEENPEGYAYTSLASRAKNLSGRLMIVHGTYDDNVHPQNTWLFADELIAAGIPFDMMIYPMRKHGISDAPARKHLSNKMLEFWKLHL